ncbi:hypothetical protein E2C01_080963 [Portunus trituberculatus]|uniref:Uncharacterized protein n=1 Tax=Portunus trituberculatus TaxID=210409 RepID=A0A5B7IXE6_PORTR|nr:hypothetical protein [Portunus trituberculatus]
MAEMALLSLQDVQKYPSITLHRKPAAKAKWQLTHHRVAGARCHVDSTTNYPVEARRHQTWQVTPPQSRGSP